MKKALLVIGLIAGLGAGAFYTVTAAARVRAMELPFAMQWPGHSGHGEGFRGMFAGRGEGAGGMFAAHIASQLNLTDDQKTQIHAIIDSEKANYQPLFQQLAATHKEMQDATAGGKYDEAQVSALAAKQGQTLAQLIVVKERVKSKVYAILTPEQKAKADQMMARFGDHMMRRFGGPLGLQ